jgi:hypothetical protein
MDCGFETRKDGVKICSHHDKPLEVDMLEAVPAGHNYPAGDMSWKCPVSGDCVSRPHSF